MVWMRLRLKLREGQTCDVQRRRRALERQSQWPDQESFYMLLQSA